MTEITPTTNQTGVRTTGDTANINFHENLGSAATRYQRFGANVSLVQAVQTSALQRDGVIDESAANVILRAIDSVSLGNVGASSSVWEMVANLDDRVEAAIPGEIAGAAALGRTRSETIATALRMSWRDDAAALARQSLELRSAVVELASAHAVTVLGVFADRKAAAPSTLAHFLGGFLGPLESGWKRLLASIDAVNRSPFGAGLLVGEAFGTDRDYTASMLGFASPIENTIDASGQIEDVVELLDAVTAQAAIIRRFVNELLLWIRTDPTSFFIDERWESGPEPAHAAHNVSTRLEHLNIRAHKIGQQSQLSVDLLRAQPYGPIGIAWDSLAPEIDASLIGALALVTEATGAIREALIVNRAYLANRAGRLYSTASDLSAFLMEDQQLSPAAAQKIAGLAVARLKEATLEASQITPDIIDAAAVMVIGQELKVEMETLGRYIAPRRYIERRDVLGSPKADRTRDWLARSASKIETDRDALTPKTSVWTDALANVKSLLAESAESSEN